MSRQFVPMAVLALIDWLMAFVALYVAVCIRYQIPLLHLRELEIQTGPLWPRAAVFASVVVACLQASGLYGQGRTHAFLRVAAALVVASFAMSAIYYLLPALSLWRGVFAQAAILAGLGVAASRLVTGRIMAA